MYSHEIPYPDGPQFGTGFAVLPPRSAALPTSHAKTSEIPCRFHLLGRCKKGTECPYEHSKHQNLPTSNNKSNPQSERVQVPPEPSHVEDAKSNNHPIAASEPSMLGMEVRSLRGASVTFGPGAQVQKLDFPSDYSAVHMTSLQPNCDAATFQRFMARLGETVPVSFIRVRTVTKPPSTVASVRIRNTGFAQRLKLNAENNTEANNVSDIAVTIVQVGIKSESSVNRLQMSTVSCTWYKASRIAWLHYNNTGMARAFERFIASRDYRIEGRKIQATLQLPKHYSGRQKSTITSVQLGNLDASTSQALIERHIPAHLTPTDLIVGEPSYSTSIDEAEECVKDLLDRVGPLEGWELSSTTSATQVKAIARFETGEDARRAVNQLNGQKIPQLANSKLFVSLQISVKFNVPKAMYRAIREDVDYLKSQAWDSEHVYIKSYPPADATQKFIRLRLFGEDAKAVAKAKSALEKILAGDVIFNGDLEIWDDFFAESRSLAYLNELSLTHQGYVYRDMRKHRLSIYGSANSKENIRRALIEKLDSLIKTTHSISLSADDLKKALHGGFRRIVAALGKQKASLDIRQRPQIITITGSTRDLKTARTLLDQDVASHVKNLTLGESSREHDCAVCWTEAENAYRTPCGHYYCASCFASQCSSTGEGDLPVRCLGDSATCPHVFGLQELKDALPSPAFFDQLLQDSFTAHVRTHPKSIQYCPTPDCPQIYRVTATGAVTTCSFCLTPICTTCQVTAHDGMDCHTYAHVGTSGDDEFRIWKRENSNKVKDCPGCGVPIEKSEGCNHVECRNCGTHMCWVCLKTFDEGRMCYGHMREVHGSYVGGGW